MNELDLEKKLSEIRSLVDAYGETIMLITDQIRYLSDKVLEMQKTLIKQNDSTIRFQNKYLLDGLIKMSEGEE